MRTKQQVLKADALRKTMFFERGGGGWVVAGDTTILRFGVLRRLI